METELAAMAMSGHIQQNEYIYFIHRKYGKTHFRLILAQRSY